MDINSRPSNHVICPSCYYRNSIKSKTCENCGRDLELHTSSELESLYSDVVPEPVNDADDQQPKPPQNKPLDKNKQPIEDIRKVKREDLDWLSMLDLDADILSDPPSRPISKDNLLTTDWINKLVPQSDELPNLPELDQLPSALSEAGQDDSGQAEDEDEDIQQRDQSSGKRSEVFDLLLRDDLDLSELRGAAAQASNEEPTTPPVESSAPALPEIDLIDEYDDKTLEAEAAESLDSWLSDIAADYIESAEEAANQSEEKEESDPEAEAPQIADAPEVDEVLDSIPDWLSWEDQAPENTNAEVASSAAELENTHLIEQNEALGKRTLPSETIAPEVVTSIEELLESTQSQPAALTSDGSGRAHTEEPIMPTSQNNSDNSEASDEKLQAWLADLEHRAAEKYGTEDSSWVTKSDQDDPPTPYQLDTIPEWIKENNDPFGDVQDSILDDDDDLEWIIGPDELSGASGVSELLKPEDTADEEPAQSESVESLIPTEEASELLPTHVEEIVSEDAADLSEVVDAAAEIDPIDSLNALWSGHASENEPEDLFPLTSNPEAEESELNIEDMFFGDELDEPTEAETPSLEQPLDELLEEANSLIEEHPIDKTLDFDPFKTPEGAVPVPQEEALPTPVDELELGVEADMPPVEELDAEEDQLISSIDDLLGTPSSETTFDPFNTPVVPQSSDYDFDRVDPLNAIGTSETDDLFAPLSSEEIPAETLSDEDIEESIEDLMAFLEDDDEPDIPASVAEASAGLFDETDDDDDIEELDFFDDEYTRPSAPINLEAFSPQAPSQAEPDLEDVVSAEVDPFPTPLELPSAPEQLPEESEIIAEDDGFAEMGDLLSSGPLMDESSEEEPKDSWFESLQNKTKAQMRIETPDGTFGDDLDDLNLELDLPEPEPADPFSFEDSSAFQSFNEWVEPQSPEIQTGKYDFDLDDIDFDQNDAPSFELDSPAASELDELIDSNEGLDWIGESDDLLDAAPSLEEPFSFSQDQEPEIIDDIPTTPTLQIDESVEGLSFDEWLDTGASAESDLFSDPYAADADMMDDDDDLDFISSEETPQEIGAGLEPLDSIDNLIEEDPLEALAALDEAIVQAGELESPSLPDWAKELQSTSTEADTPVNPESNSSPLHGIQDIIDISPVIARPVDDLSSVQQPRDMRPEVHKIKAKQAAESARAVYSGDPTKPVAVPKARQRYQPRFDPNQYDGMSKYTEKSRRRNILVMIGLLAILLVVIIFIFTQSAF